MTREDVIDYYGNINNRKTQIEFLKKYTEHKGKVWDDAFLMIITPKLPTVLEDCFNELFREFEITRVEDIATEKVLKLV